MFQNNEIIKKDRLELNDFLPKIGTSKTALLLPT